MEAISPEQIIAVMPALITAFTSYIKPATKNRITPFIPYIISIILNIGMRLTFGQPPIQQYIRNALFLALATTSAYNQGKNETTKS